MAFWKKPQSMRPPWVASLPLLPIHSGAPVPTLESSYLFNGFLKQKEGVYALLRIKLFQEQLSTSVTENQQRWLLLVQSAPSLPKQSRC